MSHAQIGIDSPVLRDRMADLAWRTARRAGLSRRASLRLCRRVLADVPASSSTSRTPLGTRGATPGAKRRARSDVLAALRAHLRPTVDPVVLERALSDAVVWDEVALLPPRQRLVLTLAAGHHATVSSIARDTGWSQHQVTRLVRAALTTVTLHTRWQ